MKDAIEWVQRTGWTLMTHCLETEFRREERLRKFGLSTVELLSPHNLFNEHTILFHCIEASENNRALLVHCPVFNRISSAQIGYRLPHPRHTGSDADRACRA